MSDFSSGLRDADSEENGDFFLDAKKSKKLPFSSETRVLRRFAQSPNVSSEKVISLESRAARKKGLLRGGLSALCPIFSRFFIGTGYRG